MTGAGIRPREDVIARFDGLAANRPDDVFLVFGTAEWTFGRLADQSLRLAASLLRLGVGAGSRVALHAFNSPDLVVACLGCLRIGAIIVPINTRLKTAEIATLCEQAKPNLYIGQKDLMAGVDAERIGSLPEARFLFDVADEAEGASSWVQLLAHPPIDIPAPKLSKDHPAFLLGTSGTTGTPKLVVWTRGTLQAIADAFDGEELRSDDVILQQMPMMHAGGLLQTIYAICYGARLVLIAKFDENVVLDAVQQHDCTAILATPTMYAAMLRSQRARRRDVSSLRLCITAGDVCPPEVEQAFHELTGRLLLSRWGSTEDVTTARHGLEPGPFIRPASRDCWKIVGNDGADAGEGEAGELWTRSAGTTPGYWRPDGSIDRLSGGWFHSGDRVRQETENRLRYLGRTKDLIVRGGSNIAPIEVEAVLAADDRIKDVAVLGVPDVELGHKVGAVIVPTDGFDRFDVGGVIATARGRLADYKLPELIKLVNELPRNALGKVDRKLLVDEEEDWQSI